MSFSDLDLCVSGSCKITLININIMNINIIHYMIVGKE